MSMKTTLSGLSILIMGLSLTHCTRDTTDVDRVSPGVDTTERSTAPTVNPSVTAPNTTDYQDNTRSTVPRSENIEGGMDSSSDFNQNTSPSSPNPAEGVR